MNVHYHLGKGNVAHALSRMSMGSTAHVEDEKKELVKEVHRLARQGERLIDSTSVGVSVHPSSESSLVAKVKKDHHHDHVLLELKDSVLININESFSLGGDGIHRYQDRLCILDVNNWQNKIVS